MRKRSDAFLRLIHEQPRRCPICEALLGGNEMGIRSHFRRHLKELAEPMKTPHMIFFQFLGPEYYQTSIFEDYAKTMMNTKCTGQEPHNAT